MQRAPCFSTISIVPSVDPESTTTISSQNESDSRHRPMHFASFKLMTRPVIFPKPLELTACIAPWQGPDGEGDDRDPSLDPLRWKRERGGRTRAPSYRPRPQGQCPLPERRSKRRSRYSNHEDAADSL